VLARTGFNLLVVFTLCGLWHGASWTFVAWGLYHGVFLLLERTRWGVGLGKLPRLARHAYTLVVVMVGWVFFRAESWAQALGFLRAMFGFSGATFLAQFMEVAQVIQLVFGHREAGLQPDTQLITLVLTNQVLWTGMVAVVFSTPFGAWLHRELLRLASRAVRPLVNLAVVAGEPVLLTALLVVSSAWLADGTYNPFIYFRF
jgi:alginate O-acetyltransferase complex protein AlgI